MIAPGQVTAVRSQPSAGYFIAYSLGCAGIAFTSMAGWAVHQSSSRLDPTDGIGNAGAIGLVTCFAMIFAERLTRWDKLSAAGQHAARLTIGLLLMLFLLAAVWVLFLSLGHHAAGCANPPCGVAGHADGNGQFFAALACVCQLGTLMWVGLVMKGARGAT